MPNHQTISNTNTIPPDKKKDVMGMFPWATVIVICLSLYLGLFEGRSMLSWDFAIFYALLVTCLVLPKNWHTSEYVLLASMNGLKRFIVISLRLWSAQLITYGFTSIIIYHNITPDYEGGVNYLLFLVLIIVIISGIYAGKNILLFLMKPKTIDNVTYYTLLSGFTPSFKPVTKKTIYPNVIWFGAMFILSIFLGIKSAGVNTIFWILAVFTFYFLRDYGRTYHFRNLIIQSQ